MVGLPMNAAAARRWLLAGSVSSVSVASSISTTGSSTDSSVKPKPGGRNPSGSERERSGRGGGLAST